MTLVLPAGGGTVSVNAASGVARFNHLSTIQAGTGYTAQATATGLSAATSSPFNVVVAKVSKLAVTSQPPASVAAGTAFGLTITAEDQYGNVATGFTGSVSIALLNNPGGSTLGGTLMVTAVKGVAKFSGLTLNKAGSGYTLRATGTGVMRRHNQRHHHHAPGGVETGGDDSAARQRDGRDRLWLDRDGGRQVRQPDHDL